MTYITDDNVVLWTSDDGTQRIRAQRDDMRDIAPDNDGAMITLMIDGNHADIARGGYTLGVDPYRKQDPDFEGAFHRFDDTFGYSRARGAITSIDVFERYLRIFHGTTTFYEYGPNNWTDYRYVTFDTAVWRRVHLLTDEHMAAHPDIDWSARADFREYRHFLEGDSYGLIHEHKVRLHVTKEDLAFPARPWEDTETDEWEEQDAVWGFFTDKEEDLREWGLWQFGLDKDETPASS